MVRALPILLLTLACGAPKAAPASAPNPTEVPVAHDDFKPTLEISPASVALAPGATQVFHAAINYPEGVRYMRQPVKFEVVEAEGGAITRTGLYTAPSKGGTFHVRVTREDFPEISRTATVTVAP